MHTPQTSILIIYTGGTIGMKQDPITGMLHPFNFEGILEEVPELKKFGCNLQTISFQPPIDSSDVDPEVWVRLASIIEDNYSAYNGFVILHGTDTMAYTASALSFIMHGLSKPIILTGSQLPIGMIRTDGKENLVSAIEIAAAQDKGKPIVPEVCIFFENKLFRGNRTTKHNTEHFNAFRSNNYPPLAEAGITIRYYPERIKYTVPNGRLTIRTHFDPNVAVLKLFPGISPSVVDGVLNTFGLKALVLETFGSGNSPSYAWFIDALKKATQRGVLVLNVTQCPAGSVSMGKYPNGKQLQNAGVLSGGDITFEAAIVKLMLLLGSHQNIEEIKTEMLKSINGEITH